MQKCYCLLPVDTEQRPEVMKSPLDILDSVFSEGIAGVIFVFAINATTDLLASITVKPRIVCSTE